MQMFCTTPDGTSSSISNQQPAKCNRCHRTYANGDKLKQHVRKYCLKEKKYQCFFCEYRSKRKDHIRRHMDRVHPMLVANRKKDGLSLEIEASGENVDRKEEEYSSEDNEIL